MHPSASLDDTSTPIESLTFRHCIPLVIDYQYRLYPDRIEVTGSRTWIPKIESVIWLRTLSLTPTTVWIRSSHFQWSLIVALCIVLIGGLMLPGAGPATIPILVINSVLLLAALTYAFRWRHLIRYTSFATQQGATVISVGDAGPDSERFEAFVQELIRRVQAAQLVS